MVLLKEHNHTKDENEWVQHNHSECWTSSCKARSSRVIYAHEFSIGEEKRMPRWYFADVKKPIRRNVNWEDLSWGHRDSIPSNLFLEKINNENIKFLFLHLAKQWKSETAFYSVVYHKYTNRNYLSIIGLGLVLKEPIVKLILDDLMSGTEYWHFALKSITNANPVPRGSINNLKKVRDAWLEWGNKHGFILY